MNAVLRPALWRCAAARTSLAAIAGLWAALALTACGSDATTSSGGAGASDASATSDTALGDSSAAGDTAKTDTKGDSGGGDSAADASGGADVAVQDTGVGAEQIAAQLKAAKKAEADFYLALCKLNFTCDTGLYLSNAEGCAADLAEGGGLTMFFDGLAAVQAGRASFDSAKAAACLATLDASCTFFKSLTLPAACHGMFTGLVDNAFQCSGDVECKSGYCKLNDANDAACPGVCAAAGAAGASCDSDSACQFPLWCLGGKCASAKYAAKGEVCEELPCAEGLVCIEGASDFVCDAPTAIGEACGVGEYLCAKGSYCKAKDAESEGACTASLAEGKPCDRDAWYDGASDNPCAEGTVCVPLAADATEYACKPYAKVGGACTSTDQCKGWDEACFSFEDGSDQCDYLPGEGEACEPLTVEEIDAGYLACLPPFGCDAKTKKCAAMPGAGKACIEMSCAANLWCDGDWDTGEGTCKGFGKSGEACQSFLDGSSTCAEGLMCGAKSETCVAPVCK